jgi:hypothetical protein
MVVCFAPLCLVLLLQVGSSEDFWREVSFRDKVVYPHQVNTTTQYQQTWQQQQQRRSVTPVELPV